MDINSIIMFILNFNQCVSFYIYLFLIKQKLYSKEMINNNHGM